MRHRLVKDGCVVSLKSNANGDENNLPTVWNGLHPTDQERRLAPACGCGDKHALRGARIGEPTRQLV